MGDAPRIVAGYALREKRIRSFILPELLESCSKRGIKLVAVDSTKPLLEQGSFDVLLHKIDGAEWAANLKSYQDAHPETVIVDPYDAVHKMDNRKEMLEVIDHLDLDSLGASFAVPMQIFLETGTPAEDISGVVAKSGLKLPAVAKPLEANGTVNSHSMGLVLTEGALKQVTPPAVLQEFVNHGGILFKLYLLGDLVMVFRRQSLPDIPPLEEVERLLLAQKQKGEDGVAGAAETAAEDGLSLESIIKSSPSGIVEFNRISNVHLTDEQLADSRVTDPPPALMTELGRQLQKLTGLRAFNVDVLREGGHGDKYYIVDINYMPGYERIPGFENFFADFLEKLVQRRRALLQESSNSQATHAELIAQELAGSSVSGPTTLPYPVMYGKKKWLYVRAAMKFCGLEHRNSKKGVSLSTV